MPTCQQTFGEGAWDKWLKCLGPLGSITAAEKHSNTKHWLNNMVIIPIEVFRKYLYNFGVWIECSTQVFYSYKPKSLNSIVVRTWEHIGRGFLLDITLITTVHLHSKYEDSTKCSRCSEEQTVFIDGKVTAVTIYAFPCETLENHSLLPHKIYCHTLSLRPVCSRSRLRSFLRCLGQTEATWRRRWMWYDWHISTHLTLQTHLWTHLSTFSVHLNVCMMHLMLNNTTMLPFMCSDANSNYDGLWRKGFEKYNF